LAWEIRTMNSIWGTLWRGFLEVGARVVVAPKVLTWKSVTR